MSDEPTPTEATQPPADAAPPTAETPADAPVEAPVEDAVEQPQAEPQAPPPPTTGVFLGTGRRKTAVARVRLTPGDGKILINKRELNQYFNEPHEREAVTNPLSATDTLKHWNVTANVRGGGHSGQADAVLLGVARALLQANKEYEPKLREAGYLTRDSRRVERKKYGRAKARKRFQFSKR